MLQDTSNVAGFSYLCLNTFVQWTIQGYSDSQIQGIQLISR